MTSAQILIGLLGFVAVAAGVAARTGIPAPILLVAGGVIISLVPGLPIVALDPDTVFFVFLPPLLYAAAFNTSPRQLRAQARHIALLAIGLVLATTVVVAVAVKLVVPGFGWPEAFVLGAVLAPTDPVAAVAIMKRLNVSPRIAALIEGESLVNDGTALVTYRVAIGAATSGTFSLLSAIGSFVVVSAGGVAVGVAIGFAIVQVRKRIDDAEVEIAASLFTPYAAYIAAEAIGVSGILAVVTVGLYVGTREGGLFSPRVRVEAYAFWRALGFLLESALFLLMGLQFRHVAPGIEGLAAGTVALACIAAGVAVIGLRLVWMFGGAPLLRRLIPGRSKEEPPRLSPGERLVVGWSGMRGAVSLAAALAVPGTVDAGAPFPERELIIFVTFVIIVFGVIVQGVTLPSLIRRVGLQRDEGPEEGEQRARLAAADAALERLAELERGDGANADAVRRMRQTFEARRSRRRAPLGEADEGEAAYAERHGELRADVVRAEREAVQDLYDRGELDDDSLRRIERDLDLEEVHSAG